MKYNAVVITVSDGCYRGERADASGPALSQAMQELGINVGSTEIVPDEKDAITVILQKYIAGTDVHLILTTGGTGFGPRYGTPEATRALIDRLAPGIAELLRAAGSSQTVLTWLSRGEAGIAGNKLIVNLPGSPKAMPHSVQTLKPVLFHALDLLNGAKPH